MRARRCAVSAALICHPSAVCSSTSPSRTSGGSRLRATVCSVQVDVITLMLGTNDCKTYNHASADRIGKGIEKLIQQIRKADPAIDILLVSPIELGEDVWKPGFDLEFDQHSVKVSKQLKQTYLKIAWKYGCDFLAASDVAKPSKADMEHMNEKGHKNLAKAIESFLVEKERNHSNNYVNVV